MAQTASYRAEDGVGIVQIDSPPVNALGAAVRKGLVESLQQAASDDSVSTIVLICAGRTFFAGADITEFEKAPQEPLLPAVLAMIEGMAKPVIAAIHGTALGGGLELALVCGYRIAVPSARMGLPEVHLGILPGLGGTQRLPRIVGAQKALELITSGQQIGAKKAHELGVVDALAREDHLLEDAVAFARSVAGKPVSLVRNREERIAADRNRPELFDEFRRKNARAFRGFKAPEAIIQAVEAAVNLPFDEGIARERALFKSLESSPESRAQRYFFFAERQTTKIPDVPPSTPTLPVGSVGVIGAGTMGGGITMNFLNAGIPVTLVETSQAALDRGTGVIRRNYENSARKGRITAAQVEERMALIKPTLSMDDLSGADLVIEAVFEEMAIKKEVFGKLDAAARPGAILASNTSYLNLDEIASVTARPEWVIGLHFFSPANVMRLLEVVRGERTSKEVIATAMKLARTIGKVPVLSRVCEGFIANRVMVRRSMQANALVLQGPTPQEIDQALYDYGFAMGPFAMNDLVGLDVIGRGSTERTVSGDLVALGRLGQKQNGGYYDYDENRTATPSPVAARIIAEVAEEKGARQIGKQAPEDIVARLLYPVVNEGAKLLDEGVALRASDIDVACVLGYNWPVYKGGPMFWADTLGLPRIVETLRKLQAEYGDAFAPSRLLVEKAERGERFTS